MSYEQLQTICQVLVLVCALLTGLATYGAYHFGQKAQKEKEQATAVKEKDAAAKNAYSGVLTPESKVILSAGSGIYPEMQFGDSGTIFIYEGPQGSPLFRFAEDNAFTITTDGDGSIKVSTVIRDKTGAVVAELIENEWKVNKSRAWDRNYSKNALEVRDDTGDVVLQVRLTGNRIQLQAKFYDSTGGGIAIGKLLGPTGWGGGIEMTGKTHPRLLMKFEPMFKYPSESHLGEFAEQKRTKT